MRTFLAAACLFVVSMSAQAAESVTATVGHMCCGSCKASATAGVKALAWVDGVTIEESKVTVTAKADQKVDVVALVQALDKCGFPARSIMTTSAVTFSVAHLCCPNCVTDLKANLAKVRNPTFDAAKVVVDDKAKTVTLEPAEGKSLNVVVLLRNLSSTGFSASKVAMK